MTSLPIILASGFIPIVTVNDKVSAGQVIAKKTTPSEFIVDLTKEFDEPAKSVRRYLRKAPGDSVKAGEVIAVRKKFLGLNEEKISCNVTGHISRFERDSGKLVIDTGKSTEVTEFVSPVDGFVTICDNETIEIGTDKNVYHGRKSFGKNIIGEVFVLSDAFKSEPGAQESDISLYYSLDSRAVGKIIIGKNFPRELLIKSIGMGVNGIVGTEIRNEDIEYLHLRNMQVPIIETDQETIEAIKQWKGKKIYLNSQEKVIIFLHA